MYDPGWTITETTFDPARLHHKETVFTLGNGYLGTRGTFEEGYPGASSATLINGVYDDVAIAHTELANCPDWLPLMIRVAGEYFTLHQGKILHYRRELDLRRGILTRDVRWRSPAGHTVDFHFERFTSLADHHVLAVQCRITPVDFDGNIQIQAGINGYQDNHGWRHWNWINQGGIDDCVWLQVRSRHSEIELGMVAQLKVETESAVSPQNGHRLEKELSTHLQIQNSHGSPGYPTLTATVEGRQGETITLEKIVSVYTSRETSTPVKTAVEKLAQLDDYASLRTAHVAAWAEVWQASDIVIEGDLKAQEAIRYNLFQVLQAAPYHDDRVSIPAKTLSGFAYRGHVFWDTEIFIVPFLTWTQPAIARNLLSYRYHTLPGARRKAKEAGYQGAMFAWESADTGDEVTPRWVPPAGGGNKELVRIWCGDIELHITADIAYAVWNYWQATGDDSWMCRYGAELLLDTAVFWGSRVEMGYRPNGDRYYEIRDVIGPDEYHDHVNNNAFTNRMVQWHLETALRVLDWLRREHRDRALELEHELDLSSTRLKKWVDIVERIWIPGDEKTGLIEQAENFFALKDIDLASYEPRNRSMQALLGIEGANECQVLKQADVLMLLYLLRDRYDRETLTANWNYYNPRTDHTYGSSLSPAIHAILASELNLPTQAYEHFMRAALVDLEDVRRNADEGIHAASAGGVWQAIVFGFAGVRLTDQGLVANPHLPPGWTRLKFKLNWRNQWYEFDLKPQGSMDNSEAIPTETRNVHSSSIRGMIFDLDGVLTDTAEYHYLGWKQLADDEGIAFDREANEAMRGLARRESLLHLLGDRVVTEAQFQEMMERKNRYYLELIERITPVDLLPGAVELLDELRAAGIKVAIGSASKNARLVVQRLGIADKVDAIADGYSVVLSKPAPDLFLHAAEQLSLAPEQCIVVEDAASGVEAAQRAGMLSVGLGPEERVGDADLVLPNLEGVQWQTLLTQVMRSRAAVANAAVGTHEASVTSPLYSGVRDR